MYFESYKYIPEEVLFPVSFVATISHHSVNNNCLTESLK